MNGGRGGADEGCPTIKDDAKTANAVHMVAGQHNGPFVLFLFNLHLEKTWKHKRKLGKRGR